MNQISQSLVILLITTQCMHVVNAAFVPYHSSSPRQMVSSLLMSKGKDNHRARLEKNLEDMMDRDWRLFRAKLVANEAAEASDIRHSKITDDYEKDEKHVKQEKFSNIFAAIFNSSKQNEHSSIFDGDAVGGATANSMIPESCEDPFVSKAEIPVLLKPRVVIDKHRWAHPLTHIETGCVLVANEKLGGVFHQTVVLVIEHNDVTGSTGIVINRLLAGTLNKVASETDSNVDLSLKLAFNASPVTYGGPVMQEEYSILHGYGEVEGSKKIVPGIFVGGSEKLMTEIRKNHMNPNEALFVKGHAAWVPNQLSREVSKGVWYPASVSSDFILRYAGAPIAEGDNKVDLWADILTALGGEYAEKATTHSKKGDRRMMP